MAFVVQKYALNLKRSKILAEFSMSQLYNILSFLEFLIFTLLCLYIIELRSLLRCKSDFNRKSKQGKAPRQNRWSWEMTPKKLNIYTNIVFMKPEILFNFSYPVESRATFSKAGILCNNFSTSSTGIQLPDNLSSLRDRISWKPKSELLVLSDNFEIERLKRLLPLPKPWQRH